MTDIAFGPDAMARNIERAGGCVMPTAMVISPHGHDALRMPPA